jgi:hypothetical protein
MEMPDWEVRQHRATLIRFEDKTWRVAAKTTRAGKIHYELARWDVPDHERAGRQVDYNAEYVASRDQAAPRIRARTRVTGFLRWVSPLIGFLPARTKARLELTHGVDPVATTRQSVFLEFLITIGSFALATIITMATGGSLAMNLPAGGVTIGLSSSRLILIGIVAGLDAAMRHDRILREERPPPGFYEWLVPRRPSRDG